MIRGLRNKIVAINVILASVVLIVSLIVMYVVGYVSIKKESDRRLELALSFDLEDSETPFDETPALSDIVLVVYDKESQTIEEVYGKLPAGDMLDSATDIAQSASDSGVDMTIGSQYKKSDDGKTVKIAFISLSVTQNSLSRYTGLGVAVLVLSVSAFFFISLMLAKLALKPVEENWHQQKQFIANASHELKTPISVILANTEIVESHPDETVGSQMKWIENTKSEAKRMAELVANLLFLAKSDDGLHVQLEETNLSDCVGYTVLSYDAIFYENGKQFHYDIALNLWVKGNEGQLKQLVTILLDNANKYSAGVGNIALALKANGKHAELSVSNDCVEITDEQLARLFDRFYTVDPSRNKNTGGNGLGLSIAKLICETHDGKIAVSYENGRITFVATMPLLKDKNG